MQKGSVTVTCTNQKSDESRHGGERPAATQHADTDGHLRQRNRQHPKNLKRRLAGEFRPHKRKGRQTCEQHGYGRRRCRQFHRGGKGIEIEAIVEKLRVPAQCEGAEIPPWVACGTSLKLCTRTSNSGNNSKMPAIAIDRTAKGGITASSTPVSVAGIAIARAGRYRSQGVARLTHSAIATEAANARRRHDERQRGSKLRVQILQHLLPNQQPW
jgi:hypothetical protein